MASSPKLRVAVLFGGRSAEHEISLLSARFVVESLDRNKYEPILIGIDKSGRWLLQEEALLLAAARDPRLVKLNQSMPGVLLSPHPAGAGNALQRVDAASGAPLGVDVIFPVLHGPMGEDGTVQGLLELSGLPYVGAGVLGSAVGMDKDVMKRLLLQAGLPVLPYETLRRSEWARRARPGVVAARAARFSSIREAREFGLFRRGEPSKEQGGANARARARLRIRRQTGDRGRARPPARGGVRSPRR